MTQEEKDNIRSELAKMVDDKFELDIDWDFFSITEIAGAIGRKWLPSMPTSDIETKVWDTIGAVLDNDARATFKNALLTGLVMFIENHDKK